MSISSTSYYPTRSSFPLARILLLTGLLLGVVSVLQAQAQSQSLTLYWDANTETNLAGYVVQYGTQSGIYGNSATIGKVTSHTVSGLASGTTYYLTIKAYNTSGQMSPTSNEISYRTSGTTPTPVPAPTLTSVSPASGPTAGGTAITLNGANFVSGATVTVGTANATTVNRVSASQLTATTPAGTAGLKAVKVTNPDGQSVTLASGFTYVAPAAPTPAPTLTSLSPKSGATTGGTVIMLNGSNFTSTVTVTVGTAAATSVTRLSSSQVRATTPAGTAGVKAVKVTNADGRSATLASGFTYVAPPPPTSPAPQVTSVSPTSGPQAGGTTITVRGSNFASGAEVWVGTTQATNVIRFTSGLLTARTPAGTAGAKAVAVRNRDGQIAAMQNAFTYQGTASTTPAPKLTSISPKRGPASGGTVITLNGSNFAAGVRVYVGTTLATNITRVSSSQVRATTPAGLPGLQVVGVMNPDGQYALIVSAFTYTIGVSGQMTALTGSTESSDAAATLSALSERQLALRDGGAAASVDGANASADADAAFDAAAADAAQSDALDTDGDGLPDAWEIAWGLDATSAAGDSGAAGDPDGDGLPTIDELHLQSHPRGFVTRYFAEGVANSFFDTRFALANPGAEPARVLIEFLDADGQTSQHSLVLWPDSRATVNAGEIASLAGKSFSARIESDQVVVADRLTRWDQSAYGAHAETSISNPSPTWYFAEGATHGPYELFYLLQNPTDQTADIDIRYLRAGDQPPVVKSHRIAPYSRATIHVDQEGPDVAATDVSAEITSTNAVPIVAERSMYLNGQLPFWGGTASAGVAEPSRQWFLAEGATGSFFSMFVLIANPSPFVAQVQATYLLADGGRQEKTYVVPANSRFNIHVNNEPGLENVAVASRFDSDVPIIVERTMWWPGSPSQWTEGHNSFGTTATGTKWALAEGEVGGPANASTFVLVANTSAHDGDANVTLLFEDGTSVSRVISLRANSRTTVMMDGPFAVAKGRRFSTVVEATGANPVQIVVERAMYSDARGETWAAGSNAVGTKLQ